MHTHDHTLTAMIIWEAVLEQSWHCNPGFREWFEKAAGPCGAADQRDLCIELAPHADAAWRYAVNQCGYDDCFDWEFVPAWLDALRAIESESWKDLQTIARDEIPALLDRMNVRR